jgi:hypothetical protein
MLKREDIISMVPGRELDELVAEKVMNLCVLDTVQQYGDGCVVSDKGFDEWTIHPYHGKIDDPDLLEPYSTNISSAWEVVAKFNSMGWRVHLAVDPDYTQADIIKNKSSESYGTGWERVDGNNAETTPLAICKAALLAVME